MQGKNWFVLIGMLLLGKEVLLQIMSHDEIEWNREEIWRLRTEAARCGCGVQEQDLQGKLQEVSISITQHEYNVSSNLISKNRHYQNKHRISTHCIAIHHLPPINPAHLPKSPTISTATPRDTIRAPHNPQHHIRNNPDEKNQTQETLDEQNRR